MFGLDTCTKAQQERAYQSLWSFHKKNDAIRKRFGARDCDMYERSCWVAFEFFPGELSVVIYTALRLQDLLVYRGSAVAGYAFCHHVKEVIPAEV